MKKDYILELEEELKSKGIYDESIIDTYDEFYDLGLEAGMSDEDIVKKLGKPSDVAEALLEKNLEDNIFDEEDSDYEEDEDSSTTTRTTKVFSYKKSFSYNGDSFVDIDNDKELRNLDSFKEVEYSPDNTSINIDVLSSDISIYFEEDIDKPEVGMDEYDEKAYTVVNNKKGIEIIEKKTLFKGGNDINILLPKGYVLNDLKIKTKTGDITIEDINAYNIEITTLQGDLDIDLLNGKNVSITSTSGDIECDVINTSNVSIITQSGDVSVDVVLADALSIHTQSGDINIEQNFSEKNDIKSTSGDVEVFDYTK